MRLVSITLVSLLALGAPHSPASPPAHHPSQLHGQIAAAGPFASEAVNGWVWPVDGPRVVVRHFVAPPSPYGVGHRGVDLGAIAHGVPVVAVMSGVVHFAGVVVDRPVITIRQGQVLATVEPVEPLVAEGERVQAGDVIGVLQPRHCAQACVHLGVRVAGQYVSPLLWLGGLQRAVLLPMSDRTS